MKTPLEAFMIWFDNIPPSLREYLAHLFQICTTDDTSMMAAPRKQSLESFRNHVLKMDFPLRVAARMFYIRSVFDMVILHHKEIAAGKDHYLLSAKQGNIVQLSSKQWEEVFDSWKELRYQEMSDTFIHSWASWMIKLQMEAK
jgi:hypothetical protein